MSKKMLNRRAKIKIELIKCGVSQAEIARDLKVKPCAISLWISGDLTSKRIADYINTIIQTKAA